MAVTQVSAVAAQMLQANPTLTGDAVRRLLLETALALPHLQSRQMGAGLLQPVCGPWLRRYAQQAAP